MCPIYREKAWRCALCSRNASLDLSNCCCSYVDSASHDWRFPESWLKKLERDDLPKMVQFNLFHPNGKTYASHQILICSYPKNNCSKVMSE